MNLHILIHSIIFLIISASAAANDGQSMMAKPNCHFNCGNNVTIPYPFGIGKECYHDEWYAIICNNITKKPFLSKFNMEVLEVDLLSRSITVTTPVASNCGGETVWSSTNFTGSPYAFYSYHNKFVVVGCDPAQLFNYDQEVRINCSSWCQPNNSIEGCRGINCCQSLITSYGVTRRMPFYSISIEEPNTTIGCTYAFLGNVAFLNESYYSTRSFVNATKQVPVAISWGMNNLDSNKYCTMNGARYECRCPWDHTGNPYLPNGCKFAEACATCRGRCKINIMTLDLQCEHTPPDTTGIILGSSLGVGLFFLLLCAFCLYKLIKKRRIRNLRKKFFKRNGGLLLQQQISPDEDTLKKTIILSSDELLKATDNYNENRILGQGGQGTVYKGMLTDGRITAVKKSKLIDESQVEQFINEVVILSQINHRNIVKLLGCCLETEVPLLVYEFVLNGTLYDLIHSENEDFPLSWKMRLQIAIEVAGGLAYLHSASSVPIYHRDIKSKNILLDEKFRAKIADFGTSRSIAIEQTHLTTLVCGTFGYLDPEYLQSSQFTDKSDVYSFGVVLAELLTRQKPISLLNDELEEPRSLATRFTLCAEQMRVFDIMEARIIEEAPKEEILAVSDLARRCLNLNGRKRPTMKEVLTDLEVVSRGPSTLVPISFKQDTFNTESNKNRLDHDDYYLTPTMIKSDYRSSSSSDVDPLVFYTL